MPEYWFTIILPEEFVNPPSNNSQNLNWEVLAKVKESSRLNGPVHVFYPNQFDGLLNHFLQELTAEGLMSKNEPHKGDFYFSYIGGGGITVRLKDDKGTIYYPRVREDAEEYVRHFYGNFPRPIYVTQILSLPNKSWDISRLNHRL